MRPTHGPQPAQIDTEETGQGGKPPAASDTPLAAPIVCGLLSLWWRGSLLTLLRGTEGVVEREPFDFVAWHRGAPWTHDPGHFPRATQASLLKGPDPATGEHKLHSSWTLWYDYPTPKSSGNWEDNLKKVFTFDSVENFWRMVHNLVPVSELPLGSNYHLFRVGFAKDLDRLGSDGLPTCLPRSLVNVHLVWGWTLCTSNDVCAVHLPLSSL